MFREQAIRAQREDKPGKTLQIAPLEYAKLSAAIFLAVLILFLTVSLTSYTRKIRSNGHLVPVDGIAEVVAFAETQVKEVLVREGDIVQKGEVLVRLHSAESLSDGGNYFEAAISEMKKEEIRMTRQLEIEKNRSKDSISDIKFQVKTQEQRLELLKERNSILDKQQKACEKLLASMDGLLKRQVISQKEYLLETTRCLDLRREKMDNDERRLSTKAILNKLTREFNTSDQRLEALMLAKWSEIAANRKVMLEFEAKARTSILAPRDGEVLALGVKDGDFIQNGHRLAMIAPENHRLEAHLYVPSRSIAVLEPNQSVRLNFEAFPYQKFGWGTGRVEKISKTVFTPDQIPIPVDPSQRYYRLHVKIDSQLVNPKKPNTNLVNGMLVFADIGYDERPVWQWMLNIN